MNMPPNGAPSRSAEPTAVSRTGTFQFLSLPAEMRDMVYRYLVISEKPLEPSLRLLNRVYKPTNMCTALLRVNSQICSEALDVLYANNTIILRDRPIDAVELDDHARLLERIFNGQVNKSLIARAGTLHIGICWLFSDDWSWVESCWYRRSDVERLKVLADSIAKELSSGQPDKRKTLVLGFPYDYASKLIFARILSLIGFHSHITSSPADQAKEFLRNTLDTGLADVLQGLSMMRTLHLDFGKCQCCGYSHPYLPWCGDYAFHGRSRMIDVNTAPLRRIMDPVINGRSAINANLDAGFETILAALSVDADGPRAVLRGG